MDLLTFGSNLKYFRDQKGYTLDEMQAHTGVPKSTWQGYEAGKSFPKFQDFLRLAELFEVSETDLLHTDLSKGNLNEKVKDGKNGQKGNLNGNPKGNLNDRKGIVPAVVTEPETGYSEGKYNVYDLDSMAAAGMAVFISEIDKRKVKPTLYFPWLGPGIHIRIGIGGDSMHPTIKDQDKTISTWIPEIDNLREGNVHIIFDKDDGVVCKRIYRHHTKNTFEFVSDNDIHKPYTRHFRDILAIFRISEVITTDLRPANSEINKEVRQLRADVNEIRHLMGRK